MKIIVITGPPYSGKGTQCEILEKVLSYKHISTGDVFRSEKENGTEIGNIFKEYEQKGELVPDSLIIDVFTKIIDDNSSEVGLILDGYPRSKPQVDDLIAICNYKGVVISNVLNIEVPTDELLIRAKKRATTSNRDDDKDSNLHLKRIEVFEELTKPGIEYMKTKLNVLDFDGFGSIEDLTNKIVSCL